MKDKLTEDLQKILDSGVSAEQAANELMESGWLNIPISKQAYIKKIVDGMGDVISLDKRQQDMMKVNGKNTVISYHAQSLLLCFVLNIYMFGLENDKAYVRIPTRSKPKPKKSASLTLVSE